MFKIVLLSVLLSSVAHADSKEYIWKLGQPKGATYHGCASPKIADYLQNLIEEDMTFHMTDEKAWFVITQPVDKDGNLIDRAQRKKMTISKDTPMREHTYRATTTIDHNIADWSRPTADPHQRVSFSVDFSVFYWSSDGKTPGVLIGLTSDYDPDNTGTHPNVCADRVLYTAIDLSTK